MKEKLLTLHITHSEHALLKNSGYENTALLEFGVCDGQCTSLFQHQVLDVQCFFSAVPEEPDTGQINQPTNE